jgi:hypothetical protein
MAATWQELLRKNKLIDAVALVWLLTQLGKFYTYLFEVGYLHHFGIPYQSVHIGIESFITFAIAAVFTLLALIALGAVWLFLHFYAMHKELLTGKVGAIVGYYWLSLLISGAFIPLVAYYRDFSWGSFLHVFYIATLLLVFGGVTAWVVTRSYPQLYSFVQKFKLAALGLVCAFAGIGWALYLGQWFASAESTFRSIGSNQIVVREYNDTLVTAEVSNQKLTGRYHYTPINRVDTFEVVNLEHLSR